MKDIDPPKVFVQPLPGADMEAFYEQHGRFDAVGNPIPEDLQCSGVCPFHPDIPHTHVRGNWNRPGYAREACSNKCSTNHPEYHFHRLGPDGRYG